MNATTMTPAQAVRTHPAVRRAHETLHRALETATDPQVRSALDRLADTLRIDPTLALDRETQFTLDLIMELRRQIGTLTRKADRARERAGLLADPDLDSDERTSRISRLGKIDPGAIEEESEARERLDQKVDELAGRARPDWDTPERLSELAHTLLPCGKEVQREAARLRSSLQAAAALAPNDPQVRQFQDLAEQMHTLGRTMQRER
ncbi:hypothetical protein [Nocardiopsis sp. JB363]|uniref:hypothetical protein n=1 Tax=Nocardiopsis sp. JB363 TaxID=1434837 RepID=UPI00097A7578|nr:hypothetical protein [Nocardiopsis sp. JB363]SIO84629.1 hypothetical protein BQ8420_02875 [Nocardiopsis sp. JB363]